MLVFHNFIHNVWKTHFQHSEITQKFTNRFSASSQVLWLIFPHVANTRTFWESNKMIHVKNLILPNRFSYSKTQLSNAARYKKTA